MSNVKDIIENNHGWFAVDGCEGSYGEDETWVGNINDINDELIGYEYTSGQEWQGLNDDIIQGMSRKATEDEIKQVVNLEVKRKYDVPCDIIYLDKPNDDTQKLNGFALVYDIKTDSLFASESDDIVYQKGDWARQPKPPQTVEEGFEEWHKKKHPETYDSEDRMSVIAKALMKGIWMDAVKWQKENEK